MKPTDGTRQLAEDVSRRAQRGEAPMQLLLGTGCARAAGVPAPHEIAQQVFAGLRPEDGDETAKLGFGLPAPDAGEAELTEAFYELMGTLPPVERAALMIHFSTSVPVPQFYQDLAVLIRRGYFRTVLTTNVDALLERALEGAGLRAEHDYLVHMTSDEESPQPDDDGRIVLLKLHGDAKAQFAITPQEIVEFVTSQRRLIKDELASDVVAVGYELECPPLNDWLARPRGALWWVAPEPPAGHEVAAIEDKRNLKWVTGDGAAPGAFLAELAMLLLHMPAVNAMHSSLDAFRAARDDRAVDAAKFATSPPEDPEEFEREYVRGQLRRCLEALRRLEQEAQPGDVDERLEQQIGYQRQELARLEAQLRGLESSRRKIDDLLASVQGEAQSRQHDQDVAGALSHLHTLVDAIHREYRGAEPNEHVVAASLGGVTILAERIGVPRAVVGDLASFVPSTLRGQV